MIVFKYHRMIRVVTTGIQYIQMTIFIKIHNLNTCAALNWNEFLNGSFLEFTFAIVFKISFAEMAIAIPPFTCRVVPVTYPASSLAR